MFWDKKIKCPYCGKKVLEKHFEYHFNYENECMVERWRRRGIDQDVYNNQMAGK